jgi:hypothetical protein
MGQVTLSGNPPIEISLRRSPRARRISLRVSGIDGRVTLTLPRGVSEREGLTFARSRHGWIAAALDAQPEAVRVGWGTRLPVEGRLLPVVPSPGRGTRIAADRIEVPEGRAPGATVQAALKCRARDRLAAAVARHAAALGRPAGRMTLRDTRSRWGSCTSEGNLMFSWRLILAPPEVLEYVAVHEVAHLAHMDHSPAFWGAVARMMPGYEIPRGWLRREGTGLHRWRFTD